MEFLPMRRVIALCERTQGFTLDGKPLLALLCMERQGQEYALTLNSANLARLDGGDYFLSLVGKGEETLRLSPQNTQPLHPNSTLGAEEGLAALLWVDREGVLVRVAEGVGGKVANAKERLLSQATRTLQTPVLRKTDNAAIANGYEDEAIATENYFFKEFYDATAKNYGGENAVFTGENCAQEPRADTGVHPKTDADGAAWGKEKLSEILGAEFPFPKNAENAFFTRKKAYILQTLKSHPKEHALCRAVPGGYFVRVENRYVFGVVTLRESLCVEDLDNLSFFEVVSLCYATPAQDFTPKGANEYCHFLSVQSQQGDTGYYLICQNPLTGSPEKITFA